MDRDAHARRAAVVAGREQAAVLIAAARAAEQAFTGGDWADRERQAIDACRTLAAFLAHHPTAPVASAIVDALRAKDTPPRRH